MNMFEETSGAVFSECRRYRYRLWRTWNPELPKAVFVLMNPSTADEIKNDATVERCQVRTLDWGHYGGVEVVNVYAWRETDSRNLHAIALEHGVQKLIGPDNDQAILDATKGAGIVVCGWGKEGEMYGRGPAVRELLSNAGVATHAFKINADGSPKHPLYIAYAAKPIPMEEAIAASWEKRIPIYKQRKTNRSVMLTG